MTRLAHACGKCPVLRSARTRYMAAAPVNAPVMTLAATSAGAYTRMDGVPVTQTATSSCPALCPKAASTLTTQSSHTVRIFQDIVKLF